VDFVWLGDDLAFKTGPFLSPEDFKELLLPHYQDLGKLIKSHNIPLVFHSDGNLLPILDNLIESGIKAIHPCEPQATDIFELKEKYTHKLCLIGNLDVDCIESGDVLTIEKEMEKLLNYFRMKNGYIFSSGNSITSEAKIENVLRISNKILLNQ